VPAPLPFGERDDSRPIELRSVEPNGSGSDCVSRSVQRRERDAEQAERKAAAQAQRAADAIIRRQPMPPPYAPTGRVGRIVSTDGLSRILDENDLWAEELARRVEARGTRAGIYMGDDEFAAWRKQSPHAARDRRRRDR